LFALLTLAVACPGRVFAADAIKIDGTIRLVNSSNQTNPFCRYSAVVAGSQYIISCEYFNGESFSCGSDGEDSFLLNEMAPARTRDPGAVQHGYISASTFPAKALGPIQLVWIAHASLGQWTDTGTNNCLEMLHRFKSYSTYRVKEWAPGGSLPTAIEWFGPEFLVPNSGEAVTEKIPNTDYPNGLRLAQFTVQDLSEIGGLRVATSWRLDSFRPKAALGNGPLEVHDTQFVQSLQGSVTKVELTAAPISFLPKLQGQVSITDFRFEEQLGYGFPVPVVNGDWPKRTDETIQARLAAYRASKPIETIRKPFIRNVIWLFIVLTSLAVVVLVKKANSRKSEQIQKKAKP
jgi:hypothetical protein